MMKLTILISMLAGVAVSAHESLRGNQIELFAARRLQARVCSPTDVCLNHGICQGYVQNPEQLGVCRCKDGFEGDRCEIERCGDVDFCGRHGKCHGDKCKCDEGWKGDECDDEIEYEIKLVVAKMDPRTRSTAGCQQEFEDYIAELENEDDKVLNDLSTLSFLDTTGCGDGKSLLARSITDGRRLRRLDSGDDDKVPIVIGVVLVESTARGLGDDACTSGLKVAADEMSKSLNPKKLKNLDGTVVYIEASAECYDAKRILEYREQDEEGDGEDDEEKDDEEEEEKDDDKDDDKVEDDDDDDDDDEEEDNNDDDGDNDDGDDDKEDKVI